jgi:uncharacterized protein YndB with AHSA1/START domain
MPQEATMPSAHRTVVIARPIGQVFAFFTDPANDQKWRAHVKEISAEGPLAVGSRIHQVVAGPGGRGIPADIEVTALEPEARYAFSGVAGPVRPKGEFRFQPTEGGTEVTMSLDADLGGLKKLLMSKPVQRSMDVEVAGLNRAKEVLEATS